MNSFPVNDNLFDGWEPKAACSFTNFTPRIFEAMRHDRA